MKSKLQDLRSLRILEKWADVEVFQDIGKRRSRPIISINCGNKSSVTINFRAGFISEASDYLNGNTHVIIAYSRRQNALVFDFTNNSNELGALKLGFRPTNITASITSVLNKFKLEKNEVLGEYYPVLEPMSKNSEYWVVYLNKKIQNK